ncbi:ABC transporter permease [Bdellovibrio sp. qaytius]|nr:ABC transporter permease [Bdellovibrio sp. qaytius]
MASPTQRRIFSLINLERTTLSWGLFFLAVSSVAGLIYPQFVRWLVDNVLTAKDYTLLNQVVLGLFVALAVSMIAGNVRYYLFTLSGERIVLKLREQLYRSILKQDITFFDFNRTGELMSRLSSDATTLQNTVSVNISQGLRNLAQVIGGFAFMFYTSWKLSAVLLIIIPPVAGMAFFFGRKIRALSKNFQATLADSSIVAEETISGVRTVKSFVQETNEVNRYEGALTSALSIARQRIRVIAEFMTFAMVLGVTAICFVLWFGGREVIAGSLTSGELVQFLLYLFVVAIGVGSLGSLWGDLMAGVGASQRIFEIIEREPAFADTGRTLPTVRGEVEFSHVRFSYPTRSDVEVLTDLSFKISAGQVIAFVGMSGGGKSTIASLIPRFYDPTGGTIRFDGEPITELKASWLREQIGIVSQEPILISSTIEENIRYGKPEATDAEVLEAAKSANTLEFINKFPDGFKTRVGERGIQLSGGQKQRVAIARALLKNPKLLILDEATSNLDTASEHLVQDALKILMKGRTTMIIAHRLATVKDADSIFVISGGSILQTGRHEELAADKDGLYFKLLQRQFNERI